MVGISVEAEVRAYINDEADVEADISDKAQVGGSS